MWSRNIEPNFCPGQEFEHRTSRLAVQHANNQTTAHPICGCKINVSFPPAIHLTRCHLFLPPSLSSSLSRSHSLVLSLRLLLSICISVSVYLYLLISFSLSFTFPHTLRVSLSVTVSLPLSFHHSFPICFMPRLFHNSTSFTPFFIPCG